MEMKDVLWNSAKVYVRNREVSKVLWKHPFQFVYFLRILIDIESWSGRPE